ncbi:DUF6223 family protein [Nocardia sp. NPDC050718]|uniref:DUF6223 family protein n=1 Tax=Nocardia sp. NPDC050718 TaxID=3155788 RepID=UPI0033C0D0B1
MSSFRHLPGTVAAVLAAGLVAAAPASASTVLVADAYGLTADRAIATSAAFLALFGAILGGLALARPSSLRAAFAVGAGMLAAVVGVFVVVTADGGLGTGNGIAGGYIAGVLGVLGAALGGVALVRVRRAG